MNLRNKLSCVKAIIRGKLSSYRAPLLVSWHLLNRCNRRCKYCYRWSEETKESTAEEILAAIDRLRKMGTQVIMFSGGEPLLREDIGDIIRHCRKRNIFVGLTSNGDFVEQRIKDIKDINVLKLSFEGPPEVHDLLRGPGSYWSVINAVKVAKENNITTKLYANLTKYNIGHIDYILQKATDLGVKVKFNPLSYVHSLGKDISFLFPEREKYKQVIKELISLRRSNPYIINSAAALRYLYNWPSCTKLKCYAGKLNCCITPEADVYPCALLRSKVRPLNCLNPEFEAAFKELSLSASCEECWCTSTLELNYFLDFNMGAVLNISKLFSRRG